MKIEKITIEAILVRKLIKPEPKKIFTIPAIIIPTKTIRLISVIPDKSFLVTFP